MATDRDHTRSRLLIVLALIAAVAVSIWAARTPVGPNSDRYDYLGRAHNVLEGDGARPMVAYPLRFAFAADGVPPENATRPPLWPTLIAPLLALGADPTAGVFVAALGLLTLLPLVALAGDRSFGPGAGGFAALAVATSFTVARAVWGGGPEIWIALLLFFAWSWNPIGWLYAGLGWIARIGRTPRAGLAVMATIAVLGGIGWYLEAGRITGTPLAPLQSHAELAKALDDAGGLGPYRTLEPRGSLDLIAAETGRWLYHTAWNLKEQALHLDGWLAWTLVPFALLGVLRDPRLAARDAVLGGVGFLVVSTVANDPRLLLPLLPIAAGWAGAGFGIAVERRPRWIGVPVALVLAVAPWVLPLGATPRPGSELSTHQGRHLDPPREMVEAFATAGSPGTPVVTDAAVLAWRARRPAIFLPQDPTTLDRLLGRPALARTSAVVVMDAGTSPWAGPSWLEWLEARGATGPGSMRIADLERTGTPWTGNPVGEEPESTLPSDLYVPEPLSLGPDDVPDSLVTIPVPPASREGLRVTASTSRALTRLVEAARADGVELRVVSAYRSYRRQAALYERAIGRHGPDQQWVAAPGTSAHQLGTTVDFADAAMAHVVEQSFAATDEARWLEANARRFGFVRSYTEENVPWSGYRPEPWHYRHLPATAEERP